jgi:hypothetical protein
MTDAIKKGSLAPSDASAGLIDDFDGTVVSMRAVTFDYKGKADKIPAIELKVQPDGEDEFTDYYKMGDLKNWMPTADGMGFTPLTEKGKFSAKCKGMILMKSLTDAGFDEEKLRGADLNVVDGMKFHFVRVEAPEYAGFEKKSKKLGPDGKPYKDTFIVFEKMLSEPAISPTTATAAPATDPNQGVPLEMVKIVTNGLVEEIIKKAGGKVEQKAMAAAAFKQIPMNDPNRNVMLNFLMKPDFLKETFNLEGGILSLKK